MVAPPAVLIKLVYPNGVTLILPADISVEQPRAYIGITV